MRYFIIATNKICNRFRKDEHLREHMTRFHEYSRCIIPHISNSATPLNSVAKANVCTKRTGFDLQMFRVFAAIQLGGQSEDAHERPPLQTWPRSDNVDYDALVMMLRLLILKIMGILRFKMVRMTKPIFHLGYCLQ